MTERRKPSPARRSELLQRHFRTIAKAHSIVMWTVFQPSESNVFVSRHEKGSLNFLGNAFKPQFGVTTPCTRQSKDHREQ